MGISLSSIHIFTDSVPVGLGFRFRSFSKNWQTCTDDLSKNVAKDSYTIAQQISKRIDAPVLHFEVFDSEMISFLFFKDGKIVSRYSDDIFINNKNLYDIPAMVGYESGNKQRLSKLLSCSDVDLKIAMLEEYLGVCLLFAPALCKCPDLFYRVRSDVLYRKYFAEEKQLIGKAAPLHLRVVAEYPGKLFWDYFGNTISQTIKPYSFLYGYAKDDNQHLLHPVRFVGNCLEPMDSAEFAKGRIRRNDEDLRFIMDYRTPCRVTFTEKCPEEYRGKTMILPNGCFPWEFLDTGELLLQANQKIYVVDQALNVIAKRSIKGGLVALKDRYILTVIGDSFCGYCFEPKAKILIYEIVLENI